MKRSWQQFSQRRARAACRGENRPGRPAFGRIEGLEDRRLMSAEGVDVFSPWRPDLNDMVVDHSLFEDESPWLDAVVDMPRPDVVDLIRQMPPLLESNPGAPASIYLNFTGNTVNEDWTYDMNRAGTKQGNLRGYTTPVFDTDGDPSGLSEAERQTITDVWRRVADDFSPFNINVTTVYHNRFDNGKALNVAIGGTFAGWFDDSTSGYGAIGGFANDEPNTVLVFADTIEGWTTDGHSRATDLVSTLAGTISHEAGHALGLKHHRIYDAAGNVADEYHPGSWAWTPLMGDNLSSLRTTFSVGQVGVQPITGDDGVVFNQPVLQNDLTVIASDTNGFGWRADDYGDFRTSASAMSANGFTGRKVDGIIGHWGDEDVFFFSTDGGQIHVSLDGPTPNSNLVGQFTLSGDQGTIGSGRMAWDVNHAELTATLPAGTYYVSVESLGGLDNLGMYTLTVDAPRSIAFDVYPWFEFGESPWDWIDACNFQPGGLRFAIYCEALQQAELPPPAPLPGDVNGDERFDSSDLVLVFQAGKYETAAAHDSVFAEGDWNGDGDFDSSDLVLAFQSGRYE